MLPAVILFALGTASALEAQDDPADSTARSKARPARLISFDGEREFLTASSRLRVWRREVGYRLDVDATGAPTECHLTERFRMNYVNEKLCEVLLKHHSFEPALDANGQPVEGTYEGRLNYVEMREKD
ncbi:MAG: hypothetical protein OHK0018_12880 [Erythrobacter tepidarius]